MERAGDQLLGEDGVISGKAREVRGQELNREAAIARLVAVIKELTAEQNSRLATLALIHSGRGRRRLRCRPRGSVD